MKNTKYKIIVTLFFITLLPARVMGASSGGENGPDLTWYCEALAVYSPPVSGHRQSFCYAYSPNESLLDLEYSTRVQGENSITPGCTDPYSYDQSGPVVGYTSQFSGSDEIVTDSWDYNITNLSWYTEFSASGEWAFITYTPPNPSGGSANIGPFGQVVGGCY